MTPKAPDDARKILVDRFADGGPLLVQACSNLSPEVCRDHPIPGTWSIAQLVAHLLDSDLVHADRMKRVIAEEEPALLAFDENRWIDRLDSQGMPVEEAVKQQGMASKQLQSGKGGQAGESQGKAVSKLDEAIKKLEELLRQARQEERQQKLADLLARCRRMLAAQIEVRDGTGKLDKEIQKAPGGKPGLLHSARSTRCLPMICGMS